MSHLRVRKKSDCISYEFSSFWGSHGGRWRNGYEECRRGLSRLEAHVKSRSIRSRDVTFCRVDMSRKLSRIFELFALVQPFLQILTCLSNYVGDPAGCASSSWSKTLFVHRSALSAKLYNVYANRNIAFSTPFVSAKAFAASSTFPYAARNHVAPTCK